MKRHALALAVPAALLLAFMVPLSDGFTDDGFIHVQYARNLVERGEYAFNPGEVSFGTTSPLWVLALAAAGKVVGSGEALIVVSRVLSWACGFAALAALYAFVLALGGGRMTAAAAAAALAGDAWFARWTALSMETSASVLAILLAALATAHALSDRRAAARAGYFFALASLLRPEVYLAFPVWVLAAFSTRRAADRRAALITVAVGAALLVPWLLFARLHIGSFLPSTAGAKSGGVLLAPAMFARSVETVAKVVGATQHVALLGAVLSLALLRSRSRLLDRRARFALLWIVALPLAYIVFDIQVLSRYLLLVTPLLCALGWVAIAQLAGGARAPRAVAFGAAVAVLANAAFYAKVVVPPSRAFTHDLTHELRDLARFIDREAPAGAVVAAADIGYLAFYSNRRVLDLGGLVEPETAKLRERIDYEEIVARGLYFDVPGYPRVDYFVDRELEADRFEGRVLSGHRFERVYATTVRNLGIRKPGPYYYTLYRLTRVD
jgi:hypothetical protein